MPEKTRREQIEEMLEAEPTDPELHYMLGMEHLSEGNEDKAEECLRHVMTIHADYVPSYLQLGQLYQRQGEEDQAIATYKQGIAIATRTGNEHAASEMTTFLAMLE